MSDQEFDNRAVKQRLKKNENITIFRAYLDEWKLLLSIVFSVIATRILAFSFPALIARAKVATIGGVSLGYTWFPMEVLTLGLVAYLILRVHDEKYIVEDDSVLSISGLSSIGIQTTELYMKNIRVIRVDQTFMQKIFNLGNVRVSTLGVASEDIVMRGIKNPFQRKALIERRMNRIDHDGDEE